MAGVAYTDFANIFTANQRINAGLGINVAPGATGTIKTSAGLYDQGRSTAIGEWTSVAFNAANFTGSGSMTWTVDSGDQAQFAYTIVGHTMTLNVALNTTTVGGTLSNVLKIKIPDGFTAATTAATGTTAVPCVMFDNSSSAMQVGQCRTGTTGDADKVQIILPSTGNFSASTNNTYVRVFVTFPIS